MAPCFVPRIGIGAWVEAKIRVHTDNNNHTWLADRATRAKSPNGQWLDKPLSIPQSTPIVDSNNARIY